MGTHERRRDRANRVTADVLAASAREIRQARTGSGLSLREVAKAAALSHPTLSRIERGQCRSLSIRALAQAATAVGLDVSVRLYPGGDPIRDAAHVALLARLRSRLHPSLRWRTEVPLPIAGDRRAWDAVIAGPGWTIGVEAETRLRDVQAVLRRTALKARDGDLDGVLLLIADTRSNRAAIRAAGGPPLEGFPLRQRDVLDALRTGNGPDVNGLVIL